MQYVSMVCFFNNNNYNNILKYLRCLVECKYPKLYTHFSSDQFDNYILSFINLKYLLLGYG